MLKKRYLTGFVALGLLSVVAISSVVFAETGQANIGERLDGKRINYFQEFIPKFAANLGVSEDKVTEAMESTKKQMIDEAVEQGKLTQEQADKMKSNKAFGFPGLGFQRGEVGKGPGSNLDALANVLGITTEELNTEFQSGKKIEDIVTEHGLTMDQFNQKMLELRKEEISKSVSEGKITQEQAYKMMQNMGERHHNKNFPGLRSFNN